MKCADTSVVERDGGTTDANGEVAQGTVMFPGGLLGFEEAKCYELLGSPEEAPFLWLQMQEEPGLAFLVVSPSVILEEYHPDLSPEDAVFLELESAVDAMVLNIVTVHGDGAATVNLKGPIVINRHTLRGKQVIPLNSAEFALQHPLPLAK